MRTYFWPAVAFVLTLIALQWSEGRGYERGFANGKHEAYSHIDDTMPGCQ